MKTWLHRHRAFLAWLGVFYASWLWILLATRGVEALVQHWPMAAAMALGSYFAGSTPMGGGTVGFPVLVLFMESPAALGRDFSFAVQSIGMTSAAVLILVTRQPLAWTLLRWALLGICLGTPLGLVWVAPFVPEPVVKIVFAVVWASFGVLTLLRLSALARQTGLLAAPVRTERWTGFLTGMLGGCSVAAMTGVGVDMLLYVVVVLARRGDPRVAIPTSVILMAATSLVGTAFQSLALGGMHPDVFGNWLAAAPVVVLGAPLGALVAARVGRVPTLATVSLLCLTQFVWTLHREAEHIGAWGMVLVVAGLLAMMGCLHWLGSWGDRLAAAAGIPPELLDSRPLEEPVA